MDVVVDPTRLLAPLVGQAPFGLAVVSLEKRYLHVNRELAILHGRAVEDHVGRTFEEVVPQVAVRAHAAFDQVVRERTVIRGMVLGGSEPREWGSGLAWEDIWYPVMEAGELRAVGVAVVEVGSLRHSGDHRLMRHRFADALARAETVNDVIAALDALDESEAGMSLQFVLAQDGRLRPIVWRGEELNRMTNFRPGGLDRARAGVSSRLPLPAWDVIRTGQPRFFESREVLLQQFPATGPFLAAGGTRSAAYVPLRGEQGTIGLLRWTWIHERIFSADERRVYEEIGDEFAAAYQGALVREQQHVERRRASEVIAALAPLSTATTTDEVARVVISLGPERLGATGLSIAVVDPSDPGRRRIVGSVGYPEEFIESIRVMPLDFPTPPNRAIVTNRAVYLRDPSELRREFPEIAESLIPSAQAWVALPLRSRSKIIGAITLSYAEPQAFSGIQRVELTGYAAHIAEALALALRHEEDHELAVHLQRSLLPVSLPKVAGADLAARYLPGSDLEIGGDWYDAILLDDGRLCLAVGDVMGHGVEAAVAMGQLRAATRALARRQNPAETLSELDRFVDDAEDAALATLAVVVLDVANGTVEYALAGHPPPMVRLPDGGCRRLDEGLGVPLGFSRASRESARDQLAPGSVLVLYTDGLVERRGEDLDGGLARLERAVCGADPANVEASADRLVTASLEGFRQRDDIALVCVALS